jgi:hypothetical protein
VHFWGGIIDFSYTLLRAFNLIDEDCVLYVPRGAKKAYAHTFGWNRFDSIKEY